MPIHMGRPLTSKRMSTASAWRVAMATMVPFQRQCRSSPVQRSVTWKSSYMGLAYRSGLAWARWGRGFRLAGRHWASVAAGAFGAAVGCQTIRKGDRNRRSRFPGPFLTIRTRPTPGPRAVGDRLFGRRSTWRCRMPGRGRHRAESDARDSLGRSQAIRGQAIRKGKSVRGLVDAALSALIDWYGCSGSALKRTAPPASLIAEGLKRASGYPNPSRLEER